MHDQRRPWNRRDFIAVSSLAVIGSTIPLPSTARASWLGTSRLDQFTSLRGSVGMYENRGGVMGWLISPEAVVVVDTQFADTAEVFAAGLRARTSRSIDVLLNTHHHGDHVGGNAVLRPVTDQIVAQSTAAELMRAGANTPAESLPDVTFDAEWTVTIGSETIRARHYGRGAHTGGDAIIAFQSVNVVHTGDLMLNRSYPFIDGPSGASVTGWIEVLEAIHAERDDDTLFIFGHAAEGRAVTGSRAELLVQRDFLAAALEVAAAGLRAGRSAEEIAESGPPPGFPEHDGPANRLATLYRVALQDLAP